MIDKRVRDKRKRDLHHDVAAESHSTGTSEHDDARLRQTTPKDAERGFWRTDATPTSAQANIGEQDARLRQANARTRGTPFYGEGGAGFGPPPHERQRPTEPEHDEYTEEAERIAEGMARENPRFARYLSDPATRERYIKGLARDLRAEGAPIAPRPKPEAQKSQLQRDDEFWNNPDEYKAMGKIVRPKL